MNVNKNHHRKPRNSKKTILINREEIEDFKVEGHGYMIMTCGTIL